MQELLERSATPRSLERYPRFQPTPAVHGPDGRKYLTDHHHMGLAPVNLAEEWNTEENPAAKNPFRAFSFRIIKDLSDREDICMRQFFLRLGGHNRCYPYDGTGKRIENSPDYLSDLVDDPFRSLASIEEAYAWSLKRAWS